MHVKAGLAAELAADGPKEVLLLARSTAACPAANTGP